MIHKKSIFSLFAFVLLVSVPLVTALDTDLLIKTKRPDYGVIVRVIDPANNNIIDSVYGTTEPDGTDVVTYSFNRPELSFTVILIKNGIVKEEKTFGPFPARPEIELFFYDSPNNFSEDDTEDLIYSEDNETASLQINSDAEANQTSEMIETSENNTGSITGNAILEDSELSSYSYYLIASVFLAGIIGLFLLRKFRSANLNSDLKNGRYMPPATSEFMGSAKLDSRVMKSQDGVFATDAPESERAVKNVQRDERRIKELEREIELLKKKEMLRAAEEEYQAAERELKRLHAKKAEREKEVAEKK